MNTSSKLPSAQDRIGKLESENARLRAEIDRLSDFAARVGKDLAEDLIAGDRRSRLGGDSLLRILDSLPAMIGYWDKDMRNHFANQALVKWYGMTPKQMLGRHIRDVIGEDRYTLILPRIEEVLRGKAQRFEHAVPTPHSNEVRNALAEYIPNLVDGEVQGFFVQVSDITKVKEVEETSVLLKFALNDVHEAVFMADENGYFKYFNTRACTSLGYDQDELEGMHVADIDPDYPAEMWPEWRRKLCAQGSLTFETRHKRKNGTIFPVEMNTTYFEFLGKPFILGLARDITEPKRVKNELLLQSEILKNLHEGVQITRVNDETIVFTTPVFDRMFGYAENELVGKNVSVLNAETVMPPEQIAHDINRALDESGYWQGEINNLRKDGSTFWCWVKISTFEHHEFGKVWVAVHEDITHRKHFELQREKAKNELHRDLVVREVHHRVKNNLQGIIGILRMFATGHPELADPLQEAISQVQSIAVIHGLQGRTEHSVVRLCELTSAIAAGVESIWKKPIVVDIPPVWSPRTIVESEAVPVALILNELIANAIKHGDAAKKVIVQIRYESGKDSVIVGVRNCGSIPAGFGLHKSEYLGTGLRLVASLLPPDGIGIYWAQQGTEVVATMDFRGPILSVSS